MHYVGRRASETAPIRSIPLFRSAQGVFGASPRMKADAELRIASGALAGAQGAFAAACAGLAKANRMPMLWRGGKAGCRAYHQGVAMRAINDARKVLRAAQRRVAAAGAAILALVPADDFAPGFLAWQANEQAFQARMAA